MKKYLLTIFIFLSLFCKAQIIGRQTTVTIPVTGYAVSTVSALVWVPEDYNPVNKYPFILALSGNGETTVNAVANNVHGPSYFIKNGWNGDAVNPNTGLTEEFIILSPAIHDNPAAGFNDWFNSPQVKNLLNYAEANFSIDINKEFITGLSAGGYATLTGICDDISLIPRWAAAAPVSAVGDSRFLNELDRTVTYNVPTWFTAGAAGDAQYNTCVQYSNLINSYNPAVRSIMLGIAGGTHSNNTWDSIYNPNKRFSVSGNLNLYEWFLKYSRNSVVVNQTITTLNPVITSYCITATKTASITVPYSTTGTFGAGNFVLQLSSASGLFTNPTNIGSVSSNTGSITGTIPANILQGNTYRVRVVFNSVTGSQNTTNLTIVLGKNSIAPTATQNIAVNSNGSTLTATEASAPIRRQWFDGSTPITGATGISYIPNFPNAGSHIVSLKSYYSCDSVPSNSVTINTSVVSSSRHYVTKGADNGVFLNACNGYQYNPGDTFVLRASQNPYSYVTFKCFNNIVVINEGGQVLLTNFGTSIPGGFSFTTCTNVHLTGTGSSAFTNGFLVNTPNYRGVGVNVDERSSNFEIDHVEITNKNAGMWIKMEQTCYDSLSYPNWNLHDFSIHDNFFHNLAAEGLYLGTTAPNGPAGTQHGYLICPNGDTSRELPIRLGNFHVYNNVFDSTGRAAIQLSDADSGMSEINNNTINHVGFDPDVFQGNGISLGTYTHAYVHDNYINHTKKDGIQAFGSFNKIDKNTVLNSGDDGMGHTSAASNIFVSSTPSGNPSTKYLPYDSTQFIVTNNTLSGISATYNIFVETGLGKYKVNGNLICNNSGNVFVRPGINYSTDCGGQKYVLIYSVRPTTHDTVTYQTIDTTWNDTTVVENYLGSFKKKSIYKKYTIVQTYSTKIFIQPRDSSYQQLYSHLTTHDSIYVDTQLVNTSAAKIGAFYFSNGTVPITAQIDTVKNYLGVDYIRLNITRGGGGGYNVKQANDSGSHVLLTVNNSSDGAAGFGAYLDSLFNIATPEVLCIRNEPTQNSTSLAAYLTDLQAAITVAHNHGVLIADGGITPDVAFYMYNFWYTHGKQDSALKLKQAFNLNTTGAPAILANAQYDTLLNAYITMGLDFLNIHSHEPIRDTSVTLVSPWFPIMVNFLHVITGLPFFVGEYGTWNHSCQLLEDFSNDIIASGAEYLIYFDGNGNAGQDIKLQDCFKTYVSGL